LRGFLGFFRPILVFFLFIGLANQQLLQLVGPQGIRNEIFRCQLQDFGSFITSASPENLQKSPDSRS
jgi:hypothetical protein